MFRGGNRIPQLAKGENGLMLVQWGKMFNLNFLYPGMPQKLIEESSPHAHGMRLGVYMEQDVMMVAAKLGQLDWMDAPFTPHLEGAGQLDWLPDTGILHLIITWVDSRNGIIKHMCILPLSEHFSRTMVRDIHQLMKLPFDYDAYRDHIRDIYRKYTSWDLGSRVKQDSYICPERHK